MAVAAAAFKYQLDQLPPSPAVLARPSRRHLREPGNLTFAGLLTNKPASQASGDGA
jgi:hypothetical protein